MYSQTLDQVKARLLDTSGLADVEIIDRLALTAWEDTIRAIDTEQLGVLKVETVTATAHRIRLPDDFLELIRVNGMPPSYSSKLIARKDLAVSRNGEYLIEYHGMELDEEGVPLVLDVALPALLAMIDYLIYKFKFDTAIRLGGGIRAISAADVQSYHRIAIDRCAEARGEVNLPTFANQLAMARTR